MRYESKRLSENNVRCSIGGFGCGGGGVSGDTDALRGIKTIGRIDLSISFSCTEEGMGRRGGVKEDVSTNTQIWDVEKRQEKNQFRG